MCAATLEKFLRVEKDILVYSGGDRKFSLRVRDAVVGTYEDDRFYSVTTYLFNKLRRLFPEVAGLPSSPISDGGKTPTVDEILDGLNLRPVARMVNSGQLDVLELTEEEHALLLGPLITRLDRHLLVNLLQRLSNHAQQGGAAPVEVLPFCTEEEYDAVAGCDDNSKSLKWYGEGKIPPAHIEMFLEMHPKGVVSQDRKTITVAKPNTDLFSLLELKEVPAWISGLTIQQVSDMPATPVTTTPPASAVLEPAQVEQGDCPDGAQHGIDHVNQWCHQDATHFNAQQTEICFYGFLGGKQIMAKVTGSAIQNLFKGITVGNHEARVLISLVAEGIRELVAARIPTPLTPAQYAVLAAGQFLRRKNIFDFKVDGQWERVSGE